MGGNACIPVSTLAQEKEAYSSKTMPDQTWRFLHGHASSLSSMRSLCSHGTFRYKLHINGSLPQQLGTAGGAASADSG